jgi:tetratricopeptide (TPR) repeat protein
MLNLLFLLATALTPEAEAEIHKGIEASHVEDYVTARIAYAKAKRLCPRDPAPYFLDGALTFIYMVDFVTDSLEERFDKDMNSAEKLAMASLEENGENARDLFFIGSVRIFQMVRYGWKRQYIRALSAGSAALDPLFKVVELDPYLWDAYLAKGALDYFSGRVNRYIPGLPAEETVEQGIEEIRMVYDKGTYFKASAGQALSWMLKEEGRAKEALAVSKELVARYPRSRTFRWGLGELYVDLWMWEEAEELYKGLLADVRQDQPKCYTNIYQIKLRLAQIYDGMGDEENARRCCLEVIANRDRIRRDLGYSDIVKDAQRLLRKLGG